MREILFRGKANSEAREGEWVFGSLLAESENTFPIIARDYDNDEDWISVNEWDTVEPQTVGQYTGLTDKNGKKIFEGDVVSGLFLHSSPVNGVVAFRDGSFGLLWSRSGVETFWAFTSICNVEYEVIGNIHDNPELLKGGGEG